MGTEGPDQGRAQGLPSPRQLCIFSKLLSSQGRRGKRTGKGNGSPKGVMRREQVWKERIRGLQGVRKQSKWSRTRGLRARKAQDGSGGSRLRSRPGFRRTGLQLLGSGPEGSGQGPGEGSMRQGGQGAGRSPEMDSGCGRSHGGEGGLGVSNPSPQWTEVGEKLRAS